MKLFLITGLLLVSSTFASNSESSFIEDLDFNPFDHNEVKSSFTNDKVSSDVTNIPPKYLRKSVNNEEVQDEDAKVLDFLKEEEKKSKVKTSSPKVEVTKKPAKEVEKETKKPTSGSKEEENKKEKLLVEDEAEFGKKPKVDKKLASKPKEEIKPASKLLEELPFEDEAEFGKKPKVDKKPSFKPKVDKKPSSKPKEFDEEFHLKSSTKGKVVTGNYVTVAYGEQCGKDGNTLYGCPKGNCCSKWGWCGNTPLHCGDGCNPELGECGTPSPIVWGN